HGVKVRELPSSKSLRARACAPARRLRRCFRRIAGGSSMRNILVAVAVSALLGIPTQASSQQVSQPAQSAPRQTPSGPAKAAVPAKPPAQAAKPAAQPSTPESRSAAELARSADPVFDADTYLRIKQTLLSYADIQVRGGWPALPPDVKLASGASGPEVALLRKHLVITGDMPARTELGATYDDGGGQGGRKFQLLHRLHPAGHGGP